MQQSVPYLFYNGNCQEAFEFYAKTLGGKIEAMLTHAGTPAESQVSPDFRDKIMHAMLKLDGGVLMASDCPPEHYCRPRGFSVSFQTANPEEAERVFAALAGGGEV